LPFIETEGSLSNSQKPDTGAHSDPDESLCTTSHPNTLLSTSILSSHLHLGIIYTEYPSITTLFSILMFTEVLSRYIFRSFDRRQAFLNNKMMSLIVTEVFPPRVPLLLVLSYKYKQYICILTCCLKARTLERIDQARSHATIGRRLTAE
jgi:hypothetical protein